MLAVVSIEKLTGFIFADITYVVSIIIMGGKKTIDLCLFNFVDIDKTYSKMVLVNSSLLFPSVKLPINTLKLSYCLQSKSLQ